MGSPAGTALGAPEGAGNPVTSASFLAPVRVAPAEQRAVPGWAAVPQPAGPPAPVADPRAPLPRRTAPAADPERPPLPRRTVRQHAVPEPKGPPAARAAGAETPVHDPGLMAAFQRGFGLAQAAESEPRS